MLRSIPVPTAARRAELVLAAACASGDAAAIAELDRRLGPLVEAIAFRLGAAPALAADALQILRCRLLVASSGRQPGIARFSGQGPLTAWLAITASRLCWRLLRQARHRGVEDGLPSEAADADDPELEHCKNRSAEALAEAFAEAVRRLPDADRRLLRAQVVGGSSIDELAPRLGVHRATVARRLAKIRRTLGEETRTILSRRLCLPGHEVESLVRLGLDGVREVVL